MIAQKQASAQDLLAPLDPFSCEYEPIHSPGAIQPHGALLALSAQTLLITHASANLIDIFGRSAESALGRPLAEVIGTTACKVLLTVQTDAGGVSVPVHTLAIVNGGTVCLRAYGSGSHICVDIEAAQTVPQEGTSANVAQPILQTFQHATSPAALCELAVLGLRQISGYDRVMAYRFHEDGHGEVIAEARAAQLEPYLGLHYPAADVPPQARKLYLSQRVGAIADSRYVPVPILIDPAIDNDAPLDLTHSCLRSVSPIHCKYMRNMKTAASMTIALANGADLWGMLVCHHQTPRIAPVELRALAILIGQVASLLLRSLGEAELYAKRHQRHVMLRAFVERLAKPMLLEHALEAGEAELLAVTDSAGALVKISGKTFTFGHNPPPDVAARALATLSSEAKGQVLAVDDLGLRHPRLASCTPDGSGAMFLPLSADTNDAILWFRPEQSRTVAWGGNPAEHSVRDPTGHISPRASFAAWEETVRGRSAPWTEVDLALAHAVRGALEFATAQRNKADLAKLRHYDYLTGLPNRSLFDEHLKKGADYAAGTSACLLFIDLDGFKEVNDKMGHAAGDAVLIEVSHRLLEAAGPANLVARLGGDEFVVLCPFMDRKALAGLGERVRKTINTQSGTVNRPWNVSSSIGIALAGETCGLNLLQAADMAMYAAKQAGGNRVVFFEASLFSRLSNRVELEQDMRDALNRGAEFVLLYQAVFGIAAETKRLVGFEVLLRWHHPKHGWMSPTTFMPLAERSGLILPLGDWVLSTALRQGRILREAYPSAKLMIHVNVSALQLVAPGYCLGVAGTLAAEAYPAEALCLEVVENLPADAAAAAVLADIRRLGVIVAIDGFGVGYASLSYLRRLPVDKLKLDRSFLENVSGDPEGMRFVAAVIAMAHAAKKSVVLEGVETEAEFHAALATGADTVQGFFFAPPMSAHAAADFVAQHSELDARHSPLLSAAPPWMVTLTSRPI